MPADPSRFDPALARLVDPSEPDPGAALEALLEQPLDELSPEQAERLAEAARSAFARSDDASMREEVLHVLATCAAPPAAAALVELLASPPAAELGLGAVFQDLLTEPERAAPFFPGLLEAFWNAADRTGALELVLRCADAEVLDPDDFPRFAQRCLDRVQEILDRRRLDLDHNAAGFDHLGDYETWEGIPDEVHGLYDEFEHLLDLLRFFDGSRAEALLRRALGLSSRTLRAWAAGSLLARMRPVEPELLEELTRHPGSRWTLYLVLRDLGLVEEFPAAARSAPSLAEAAMVHFLQDPREWGCAPELIELVRDVPVSDPPGRGFLFRFRHEGWSEEWAVGFCGVFADEEGEGWHPIHVGTASEPESARTPDEHLSEFLDPQGRVR